jgi:hypothetical protein
MKIKEIPIEKKTKIVLLEVLKNGFANCIEAMLLNQKFHVIKTERCCRCPYDFSYNVKDFDKLRDLKGKNFGYPKQKVIIDKETKIILLKVLKQDFATNEQREYLQLKFYISVIKSETGGCNDFLFGECPYDRGYTTEDYENEIIPKGVFD